MEPFKRRHSDTDIFSKLTESKSLLAIMRLCVIFITIFAGTLTVIGGFAMHTIVAMLRDISSLQQEVKDDHEILTHVVSVTYGHSR